MMFTLKFNGKDSLDEALPVTGVFDLDAKLLYGTETIRRVRINGAKRDDILRIESKILKHLVPRGVTLGTHLVGSNSLCGGIITNETGSRIPASMVCLDLQRGQYPHLTKSAYIRKDGVMYEVYSRSTLDEGCSGCALKNSKCRRFCTGYARYGRVLIAPSTLTYVRYGVPNIKKLYSDKVINLHRYCSSCGVRCGSTASGMCPTCEAANCSPCMYCGTMTLAVLGVRPICGTCLTQMRNCGHCGTRYHSSQNNEVDSMNVCQTCADTAYICEDCGMPTFERREVLDSNGVTVNVCRSCGLDYQECFVCGSRRYHSDMERTDQGAHCRSCTPPPTIRIQEYGYKPAPVFHGEGPLYFGFELEMSARHNSEMEKARGILANFEPENRPFYLKRDGSIEGFGFELVTHPHSMEEALKFWDRLPLQGLINAGMRGHESPSCGLHIHLSREGIRFDEDDIDEFISENQSDFEKFGRREFNSYCRSLRECSNKRDRHRAVNFCNRKTIELRFFRSSLISTTLKATTEFTFLLIKYLNSPKVRNWGTFNRYLHVMGSPTLKAYLVSRGCFKYVPKPAEIILQPQRQQMCPVAKGLDTKFFKISIERHTPKVISTEGLSLRVPDGLETIYKVRFERKQIPLGITMSQLLKGIVKLNNISLNIGSYRKFGAAYSGYDMIEVAVPSSTEEAQTLMTDINYRKLMVLILKLDKIIESKSREYLHTQNGGTTTCA